MCEWQGAYVWWGGIGEGWWGRGCVNDGWWGLLKVYLARVMKCVCQGKDMRDTLGGSDRLPVTSVNLGRREEERWTDDSVVMTLTLPVNHKTRSGHLKATDRVVVSTWGFSFLVMWSQAVCLHSLKVLIALDLGISLFQKITLVCDHISQILRALAEMCGYLCNVESQ